MVLSAVSRGFVATARGLVTAPCRLVATKGRFAGLCWCGGLIGTPAEASFYLYPSGTGQVIVTTTFTQAHNGFDAAGKFIPYDRFRKLDVNAYVEVGLTDTVTAVVKPNLTHASVGSAGEAAVAAAGAGSQAGARVRLWSIGPVSFALEGSAIFPDYGITHSERLIDGERGGSDLRLLAGWTFVLGRWPSFVDAEVAQRWHIGPAPDEWHGDFTFGTRPRPDILLLVQSFNIVTLGHGRPPFSGYRQHKLQISAVYDLSAKWSLQAGALLTPAGSNAPAEWGAVAAVWRRF